MNTGGENKMSGWRCAVRRPPRPPRAVLQGLGLCLLTFAVVMPTLCHRLLHSYYFLRSLYLDRLSDRALAESYARGQEALSFWSATNAHAPPPANHSARPHLLVTVVTARRTEGGEYHYLLQVMQRLSTLLQACQGPACPQVLVCDVESGPQGNEDVLLLERRFRVARRGRGGAEVNVFEKEKRDYVFCLQRGWALYEPQNVVLLEDDALPRPDFFPVLEDLLSRAFSSRTLYVKLYHPERLQRYWNPEPYRLLEWLGLGLVGGTALLPLSPRGPPGLRLALLVPYVMAVAELLGRHYLLELRRLSPQLYAVAPATECCTPAMLFPGNASLRAARYLEAELCVRGRAKDTVLYHIARSAPGERAHSLEPNLITHIGAFSSVRANPTHPRLL